MSASTEVDGVVVGSGPNGLVAAVTLARAGWRVVVYEAAATPGGGCRSDELTLPGFVHDVCAAIHPLALASPALRDLGLHRHGLEWVHPEVPVGQPIDRHRAALLHRSLDATVRELGRDGRAWRRLFGPLVRNHLAVVDSVLQPFDLPPRHPLALARFGVPAISSATGLTARQFREDAAPALFGGMAAHAMLPLEQRITSGVGLMFGMLGQTVGFPMVRGGSGRLIDALVAELVELGGEVRCGAPVTSLAELPSARAVLCDVAPSALVRLAGDRLPGRYRRRLQRFRHGPGVWKVDYALDAPIPWAEGRLAGAGTVHVGGTVHELAAAERELAAGRVAERPFVLVAQQSPFDPTRAPAGRHTAWAYCHVPAGCTLDQTDAIEAQLERFAPGFRDRVLARHVAGPADLERYNANYVGGDISGGVSDLAQFVMRPTPSLAPWATPIDGVYLCSASTPPGAGVHGVCGWSAARLALARHS